MAQIETPKMSEILKEEFMEPLGLSAYRLANDIGVPVSRIQDILHDRRKVTADTSIRLGRYFGVSERYFLNLQLVHLLLHQGLLELIHGCIAFGIRVPGDAHGLRHRINRFVVVSWLLDPERKASP